MNKILTFVVLLVLTTSACTSKPKEPEAKTNQPKKPMATTIHLTKEMFLERVANYETNPAEWKYLGDKPCIIDFYANWCAPCKSLAPILEELAQEYDGKIYIYKINTEEEQELAALFDIRSIPTLYFCPMEGNPQVAHGALPKAELKRGIEEIFKIK